MATGAWNRNVRAGQREYRCVVVESRRSPGCGAVTSGTVVRKSGGNVIRIGRVVVVLKVTGVAVGRSALEGT